MRPLLPLVIAAAALAALPAAAAGKGIADAHVCGAAGCTTVDPRFFHAVLPEGDPVTTPIAAAPFVTVRVSWRHGAYARDEQLDRFTYVPSLGVIRPAGKTQWTKLYPVRRAELDKLVAPIETLPAARLTGVVQPAAAAPGGDGDRETAWWPIAGAAAAALALLALLVRYATSALNARPRASNRSATESRTRTRRCSRWTRSW